MKTAFTWLMLYLSLFLITAPLCAQETDTELAKKTQNPVADLIRVPFQNNFNFSAGPTDATIYVLDVQPVIPLKLTADWNLITRIIAPVINQPSLFEGADSAFGLGDINPTFFLSPAKPGELIWGVGPTFTLPTATDSLLGSGKWSMGPTAVGLTMQGPWMIAAGLLQRGEAGLLGGLAAALPAAVSLPQVGQRAWQWISWPPHRGVGR